MKSLAPAFVALLILAAPALADDAIPVVHLKDHKFFAGHHPW